MPYFHQIDPIAVSVPAFSLHWYWLLVPALLGAALAWRSRTHADALSGDDLEARRAGFLFIVAATCGVLAFALFMLVGARVYEIGPIGIHWYGIMYLFGFVGGWILGNRRRAAGRLPVSYEAFSDLAFYVMLGVIVGGRVGYMLFYVSLDWIVHDPLALFRVWEGGMSFHGGLLGVLVAGWLWSRVNRVHFFDTIDFVAPLVPIGLGLGRLGNFIGGELWGKHTDLPWGMIFPRALEGLNRTHDELYRMYLAGELNGEARHPSQLYEFTLEGIVMFAVLWIYSRKPRPRYAVSGWFAILYGCFRFAVEFVREPDVQLGYLAFGWVTMGQVLSLPLIAIGLYLLWLSQRAPTLLPPAASMAGDADVRKAA